MAEQKVAEIAITIVPLDEDGKPIEKRGYKAAVTRGVSAALQAELYGEAAREAVEMILGEYEIGEVKF